MSKLNLTNGEEWYRMTDKEIIKALEYCKKGACCTDCPLKTKPNCMPILFRNVLSLLCQKEATIVSLQTVKEHQQAEIERLMDLNDTVIADLKYYLDNNEENGVVYFPKFFVEKILRNLKEMVGE